MPKRKAPRIFGGVPTKKAKREEKKKVDIRTVKLGANAIFDNKRAKRLVDYFHKNCLIATEISCLASLLFLYQVNSAFDEGNTDFFEKTHDPSDEIRHLFTAVSIENIEEEWDLPDEFFNIVTDNTKEDFVWPSRALMGNVFNYTYQQYQSNVTTNLTTHCEPRLVYFLQMKCYQFNQDENSALNFDGIDIRNAKECVMRNKDWSEGDPDRRTKMDMLFAEVEARCLSSFLLYDDMTKYIEKKWFESLYFFIRIQREIYDFKETHKQLVQAWLRHKKHPLLFEKPKQTMPPKIHNFTVVPLCDTKLKHIKFDNTDLLALLSQWKLVPEEFGGKNGGHTVYSKNHFEEHPNNAWAILFNMKKINEIKRPHQQFHRMIVCDSVSVSVLFDQPIPTPEEIKSLPERHRERIKGKLEAGDYKYIITLDPGVNKYYAGYRRNIETCVEENIKITPNQYHWGAKQGIRDKRAKRWTATFTKAEEFDREKNYPSIPSPRGGDWRNYLIHRLKMMQDGLAVYARRRYARLSLDKYIESQRETDWLVKSLTKNKPSLFTIGNADLPANSPIGKKKSKRCPGTRRLRNGVKKLHHSDVVGVEEPYTSQHCANCMVKFPKNTKKFKFKVCKNCPHNAPMTPTIAKYMSLPPLIVTKKCSRRKTLDRSVNKMIKRGIINPANLTNEFKPERLASPKMYYWKNWPLNSANEDDAVYMNEDQQQQPEQENEYQQIMSIILTVVWHRDIVAAKCILYKGLCYIFNIPLLESFKRPPQPQRPPYRPKPKVRTRTNANVVPVQVNQNQ